MMKSDPTYVAHCQCGTVEVGAWGEPIIVTACYCGDCQTAAKRLAESFGPALVTSSDGGTEFMLFRRDRIACTQGADRLKAIRLTDGSKTRRMLACCCATPMYLAFDDKRPWVSAFRSTFGPSAPCVEMRICKRSERRDGKAEDSLPSYPGYPLRMMFRILAAWPRMLFSRSMGALP